jgi:hypothetical protein
LTKNSLSPIKAVTKEKMMTRFETDKAAMIRRLPLLRIANALGMVGWRKSRYDDAEPKFRLIHPFNWILIPVMLILLAVLQGIPETVRQTRRFFEHEAVWW